jgi:hypothetical protein
VKLSVIGVAAENSPLPACIASIVQVPAASIEAVVPDTVQIEVVVDVKATANPELAVAFRLSGVPTT